MRPRPRAWSAALLSVALTMGAGACVRPEGRERQVAPRVETVVDPPDLDCRVAGAVTHDRSPRPTASDAARDTQSTEVDGRPLPLEGLELREESATADRVAFAWRASDGRRVAATVAERSAAGWSAPTLRYCPDVER